MISLDGYDIYVFIYLQVYLFILDKQDLLICLLDKLSPDDHDDVTWIPQCFMPNMQLRFTKINTKLNFRQAYRI